MTFDGQPEPWDGPRKRGMPGNSTPIKGATDVWLTPPEVIDAFGPFDLDPCAATDRPWPTASVHFTEADDGLSKQWHGFVFCNPPYSTARPWLERMAEHGNGIALIFARTETRTFHEFVWRRASAVLFPLGRLIFLRPDGKRARNAGSGNAGAPSAFVGYGDEAAARLMKLRGAGCWIDLPLQSGYVQSTLLSGWENVDDD